MSVVNSTICCTTVPHTAIDLQQLPNACTYSRFPGVSVRFEGYTAMFFASGRINVLGLRDLRRQDTVMEALSAYLSQAGFNVRISGTVKNVVVFGTLPGRISLNRSFVSIRELGFTCMLEQELYPALRIWPKDRSWTALVYHTGKVIVTGASDVHVAISAGAQMLRLLCDCA